MTSNFVLVSGVQHDDLTFVYIVKPSMLSLVNTRQPSLVTKIFFPMRKIAFIYLKLKSFIYLTVQGLCCYLWVFSSCGE